MINGSVASLAALYLMAVLWHDRETELFDLIKEEVGFVKWLSALLVLIFIYKTIGGKIGSLIQQIIIVAIAGLIMSKGQTVFKQIDAAFD